MSDRSSKKQLKVYYDGACHLCSREIDVYRAQDKNNRLDLIDISHPKFDAVLEGLDPKEVTRFFHVRRADGQLIKGVDAFVTIWVEIEIFKTLVTLSRYSVPKKLMDLGYVTFTKIRPLLPRRETCESGQCQI